MSKAFVQHPILCLEFRTPLHPARQGLPLITALIVLGLFPAALRAMDIFPGLQDIQVLKKALTMGLLPVQGNIPGIVVELRYATSDNVAKRPLYPPDMPCLLHPMTLARLKRAQKILRRQGRST